MENHIKFLEKNQKILGKTTIFLFGLVVFLKGTGSSLTLQIHKVLNCC
jgi:hypothetical protein